VQKASYRYSHSMRQLHKKLLRSQLVPNTFVCNMYKLKIKKDNFNCCYLDQVFTVVATEKTIWIENT
jgi:hypothetical protein